MNKIQLEELNSKVKEVEILELYPYYLQGEEGLKEYELIDVRRRLVEYKKTDSEKDLELFDLYKNSEILSSLFPYLSHTKLCFSKKKDLPFHCTYYFNGKYVVSTYYNITKLYFDSAKEAIEFLEDKFKKD